MENLLSSIEEITLMGPGPSCVDPSVLHAMARPTRGHLDPYFIQIMDSIKDRLLAALKLEKRLSFVSPFRRDACKIPFQAVVPEYFPESCHRLFPRSS